MKMNQIEPTQKLRGKTDKSLEDERGKTDEYLDEKSKKIEDETSEKIRLNREEADQFRKEKRMSIDSDNLEQRLAFPGDESSKKDDECLLKERARSDIAQDIERVEEDRVREKERFQKRLIAEALLENERKETDNNLLGERIKIDVNSQQNSHLLSVEKNSHDLTKAALVTRDQFLAIVSHDLRNPLAVISMGAGLLRRLLSKVDVDKNILLKSVANIERSAAIMDRMINDLLDVERMANDKIVLNLEKIDLCELLHECKDLFSPVVLNKSFSMNIEPCSKPIFAKVDHDRILQVLSNLIGNSLKFTPNGGVINLSVIKKDAEVEVSVADNGPGITEKRRRSFLNDSLNLKQMIGVDLGLVCLSVNGLLKPIKAKYQLSQKLEREVFLALHFRFSSDSGSK